MSKSLASHLEFDSEKMWVYLTDGRVLGVPLTFFPRLENAAAADLAQWTISGDGSGLHWDLLDEDISVEHLMLGYGDRKRLAASK